MLEPLPIDSMINRQPHKRMRWVVPDRPPEFWARSSFFALPTTRSMVRGASFPHAVHVLHASRSGLRGNTVGFFPVVPYRGRKFSQVREEPSNLPAILLAQGAIPRGHARVADTASNGVVEVPLRVVERVENDLGHGRVEGMLERSEERRVGKECRSRWSPY